MRRRTASMWRVVGLIVVAAATVLPGTLTAPAGAAQSLYQRTLLAKAQPDECWASVGNYAAPTGRTASGAVICPTGYQPKVNQAYVWGLTRTGNTLWFGTAPNTLCLVFGGYFGMTSPITTKDVTCEFGSSPMAAQGVPAYVGDWRPPNLWAFDLQTKQLTKLDSSAGPRLQGTLGIRSAGSAPDGTVFFAGPALTGGVNMFVRFPNGTWSSYNFTQYNDIRRWVTVGSNVYTGVGLTGGGGAILRWVGTQQNPWQFQQVGAADNSVAELALHAGRLFAGTWPNGGSNPMGIWESPPLTGDGMLPTSTQPWTEVWKATDYEPDPVTASTYGSGAMASYGGYLYWGTMHVPALATVAHTEVYPNDNSNSMLIGYGTSRAISIYRLAVTNSATGATSTRLLYGEASLMSYRNGVWTMTPNRMGQQPMFGSSGFGNSFNNYTWSMAVYNGKLFVGTMDYSYLAAQAAQLGAPTSFMTMLAQAMSTEYGADLWRFDSTYAAATNENRNGLGNRLNYGFRNMLASPDGLYVGTANPANLATKPLAPTGGWELWQLR